MQQPTIAMQWVFALLAVYSYLAAQTAVSIQQVQQYVSRVQVHHALLVTTALRAVLVQLAATLYQGALTVQ